MPGLVPDALSELLDGYPGFVPGLVVATLVAIALVPPVSRFLRVGRPLAALLVGSIGLIAAATLFPDVVDWVAQGAPTAVRPMWSCDLGRIRPSVTALLDGGEATANVLLFVPLGAAVVLLPRGVRSVAIAGAVLAPFVIELIQAGLPILDRRCQGADIADNLLGLVIGGVIGAIVLWSRRPTVDGEGSRSDSAGA